MKLPDVVWFPPEFCMNIFFVGLVPEAKEQSETVLISLTILTCCWSSLVIVASNQIDLVDGALSVYHSWIFREKFAWCWDLVFLRGIVFKKDYCRVRGSSITFHSGRSQRHLNISLSLGLHGTTHTSLCLCCNLQFSSLDWSTQPACAFGDLWHALLL